MFVIFISFIFGLIVSAGPTAEIKNMSTKEKLAKSLTHMQDMLVVIEAKIEQERKLLSQISDSLNNKKEPAIGRMDYVAPTDIWWQSSNPVYLPTTEPGAPKPGATQSAVNLSTFLPSLQTTVIGTTVPTTTETPFIQDMKKNMGIDKHKYFPAFLTRFLELIAIKDPAEIMPVIHVMTTSILDNIDVGVFDDHFGSRIITLLKTEIIPMVQNMTALALKEQAIEAYYVLKNKDTKLPIKYRSMMEFYASLFTTADGERLLRALEAFYELPKGQTTAFYVGNEMLSAVLEPYMRLQGLPPGIQLNETYRRSSNLKQNVKHILLKQPKLLEILTQRLKHAKNSQHHRLFNKQKRFKKNSKSRNGLLNERDETRRRAYVPSEEDYNNSEYYQDSIENDKLHKIREASSYSDEEDQLINNVHDALTYGNKTFKSFRKSDDDIHNKQTLRALSTETDDEWILKNNIYKVFEQDKERSL